VVVIVTYNALEAASSPAYVAVLNLVYNLSRCATAFGQVIFVAPIGETCCSEPFVKGSDSWLPLSAMRTSLATIKGSSAVASGRGSAVASGRGSASLTVHVAPEPGPGPSLRA
jgi:hypothetical protein